MAKKRIIKRRPSRRTKKKGKRRKHRKVSVRYGVDRHPMVSMANLVADSARATIMVGTAGALVDIAKRATTP